MRIVDIDGNDVTAPDYSKGRLVEDKVLVAHHPAISPVEEVYHYVVIAEYPTGGRDIKKVIDVEKVDAKDAWDEYEDVWRYIPYTEEELAELREKQQPSVDDRISELEEAIALLLSGAVI